MAMTMTMTMEDRETRALERGRQLADRIECVGRGVYAVPSQSVDGELHIVTDLALLGLGEGLACDCTAAEMGMGNPCAHRAALVIKRQQMTTKSCLCRENAAPTQRGRRGGCTPRRPCLTPSSTQGD